MIQNHIFSKYTKDNKTGRNQLQSSFAYIIKYITTCVQEEKTPDLNRKNIFWHL